MLAYLIAVWIMFTGNVLSNELSAREQGGRSGVDRGVYKMHDSGNKNLVSHPESCM